MTTYSSSFETSPKRSFNEEYESQFMRRTPEAPAAPPPPPPSEQQPAPPSEQQPAPPPVRESAIFSKAAEVFRGLELDDLLIIAIGILLLLDSDENMDTVLIFVAAMLFF